MKSALQVYQSPAKALQAWFEAESHTTNHMYDRALLWGGLWEATSAESFASNAVTMYTAEGQWHEWQRMGKGLAELLYSTSRLQVVKASKLAVLWQRLYIQCTHWAAPGCM